MASLAVNNAAASARAECGPRSKPQRFRGTASAQIVGSRRNVQCAFWGRKSEAKPSPAPEPAPQPAEPEPAAPAPAAAAPVEAAAPPAPVEAAAPPAPVEAAPEPAPVPVPATAAAQTVLATNSGTIVIKASQIVISGNGATAAEEIAAGPPVTEAEYLTGRANAVARHFPSALGQDDFMHRVEMALYGFGFTGENSIAMVNLCRDEVTVTLKHKIEEVFGSAFATNGLGGVLTCGVTGMGAGFSHSPLCSSGKERYVFFSFPHISINSAGEAGPMSRPGRPGQSCACGALIKSLNELKSEGLNCNCKIPGVHDSLDPEYTILKQRLARRLRYEGATDESMLGLDLVEMTKVAERTISDDLEYLISKTVNTDKADYAVITGVQIHNWGVNFEDAAPNMEFVAPTAAYVVVDGKKTHLDLSNLPPLTPRQMKMLAGGAAESTELCAQGGQGVLREMDAPYHFDSVEMRKLQSVRLSKFSSLMVTEGLTVSPEDLKAGWANKITTTTPARCATADNSTIIDTSFATDKELQEVWQLLEQKYKQPASSTFNP